MCSEPEGQGSRKTVWHQWSTSLVDDYGLKFLKRNWKARVEAILNELCVYGGSTSQKEDGRRSPLLASAWALRCWDPGLINPQNLLSATKKASVAAPSSGGNQKCEGSPIAPDFCR